MTATEKKLKEIVREILSMSECDLMELLPVYQHRMENFETIGEWEEAVVMYFLINACRIKNIQFGERVNQLNSRKRPATRRRPAPVGVTPVLPPAAGSRPKGGKPPARRTPSLELVKFPAPAPPAPDRPRPRRTR
ncbi:MAG: hypothetical protein LBG06_10670 [Deltaproteobacteria bacterium]|jgi:hypothetical protein|nr:hypothetical protein [Deltaproteobacteria bacterium]